MPLRATLLIFVVSTFACSRSGNDAAASPVASRCFLNVMNASGLPVEVFWQAKGDTGMRRLRSVPPVRGTTNVTVRPAPVSIRLPRESGTARVFSGGMELTGRPDRTFPSLSARDSSLSRVSFGTSCN